MWFWTVVDRPCRSRSRQCDRQRITAQDDERSATGSPSSYAHRLRSNRPHSAVASPRSAGNWRPIWGEVARSGSRQRCRSYSSTSQSTTHVTEPTASRCTSTASTRNLPRGSKRQIPVRGDIMIVRPVVIDAPCISHLGDARGFHVINTFAFYTVRALPCFFSFPAFC
jgi:hypothetical protein